MPALDITSVTVDGNYKAFTPTLRFKILLSDKNPASNEHIVGGYVDCNVSLKSGKEALWLGRFSFGIPASHGSRFTQREIEENFPLGIDVNNAMFDHVRTLDGDDITLLLTFKGYVLWQNAGNANQLFPTSQAFGVDGLSKEATISVERWRKLISTYYRNITWVAISTETYSKIRKILNEKGMVPDELLNDVIKQKMG